MINIPEYRVEREAMVARQIEARGIRNPRVLGRMREVPRHLFVPPEFIEDAYIDCPLPIGCGQTISQPFIVALMTCLLGLEGEEVVLEIGTGSGYQAAVLAGLTRQVETFEIHPELASSARELLRRLHIQNVNVQIGDGTLLDPVSHTYDRIIVTAAAPRIPEPMIELLNVGGLLVIPVGSRDSQTLHVVERTSSGFIDETNIPVVFVPLRGKHGWGGR